MSHPSISRERVSTLESDLVQAGFEILSGPLHSGICQLCDRESDNIAKRRLNTRYVDDRSNWMESCHECYQDRVDHYRDLWNEYYNSQGL